ncbi:histidine kinase [Chitinophaga filiformis]|uniref:Histidine kinase n=1 Tax=Chitinophaga filiformis TaxID=104663 RepID=A0A1G7MJC2_CHIFI|nr:histidine kinase [Chitinophaga filiformis]SDF61813.1 Histidine kinase [Chitinophaga filiformis]
MNFKSKIHIPQFLSDNRRSTTPTNPLLKRFASWITTVKFQIFLMVLLASIDYFVIMINGVADKVPEFLILMSIETAFFFAYVHFIFPKLAASSSSLLIILATLLICLILFSLSYLLTYTLFAADPKLFISKLTLKFVVNSLYRGWKMMVFSLFLWSAYIIKASAKREQVLENSALYTRLSPHLFFNALNMLPTEGSIPLKNEKIIDLLSRYTRNALVELGEDGKGLLIQELDQLDTLLQLNELRFGKIYVQFSKNIPGDITGYRIPPQSIVTLTENIFKYGIVDDPLKPAAISIDASNHYLTVTVTNYKYPLPEHPSGKIGINSVQKRLTNIYGKSHHFKINETPEVFSIEIGFPV